jgi:hypothetical protein
MLLSSSSLDFSHTRQLQRQCLRTLGIIITSSPPSTFSMLFAQQLPSVLCQCLDSGGVEEEEEEGGGMMDSLMRGPRMATVDMELSSTLGGRLTSFAYCAHTLALLLHTVSSQWGNVPFPLEVVLVPGLMNDFDQLPRASPSSSSSLSRGHRKESFAVHGGAAGGGKGREDEEEAQEEEGEGEGEGSRVDDSTASPSSTAEALYCSSGTDKVALRQVSTRPD